VLKIIISHNLGNVLRPIYEWYELPVCYGKVIFLQIQPHFVAHLKLMWHPMLIMSLLVLGIELLQDVVNLLADVLDEFNKFSYFINLR